MLIYCCRIQVTYIISLKSDPLWLIYSKTNEGISTGLHYNSLHMACITFSFSTYRLTVVDRCQLLCTTDCYQYIADSVFVWKYLLLVRLNDQTCDACDDLSVRPPSCGHISKTKQDRSIDLLVPRTSTSTYGPRSFAVSGPSVWNKLPATLRISPTLGQFQSKLKAVLFRSAYETWLGAFVTA